MKHLEPITTTDWRQSRLWEIYLPLAAAAVPATLFALLGLVTKDFAKPQAEIPLAVVLLMILLQGTGVAAMAIVSLIRLNAGYQRIPRDPDGRPAIWRKLAVQLSVGCLLVFDVLTNLAAALAGASFLLLLAIPAFLAYLVISRLALGGRPAEHDLTKGEPAPIRSAPVPLLHFWCGLNGLARRSQNLCRKMESDSCGIQ
ncbi:MAG: hypothetical protein MK108_10665 [Mariniblastus sp.]|nr:hypothetical protein [Mariniblastus sp.]